MSSSGPITLFGGSFDPIHHGHLIVARAVAEQVQAPRVILLPSRTPPHKPDRNLAAAEHRAAMVQLAIAGDDLFECSDHDLTCPGPSYTVNTVRHFQGLLADSPGIAWIIGADSLRELHLWYHVADLVASCRILTAARPGFVAGDLPELRTLLTPQALAGLLAGVLTTPCIEISATDIRRRVAAGQSIRNLVPAAVREYIHGYGLYAPAAAQGRRPD